MASSPVEAFHEKMSNISNKIQGNGQTGDLHRVQSRILAQNGSDALKIL